MKKYILLLCLSTFTTPLFAAGSNYGLYLGGNGGIVQEGGKGAEQMKGGAYGLNLGYRWISWGLEVGYTKLNLKAEGGQASEYYVDSAEIEGTALDFVIKTFFWRYFTLGLGFSSVDSDDKISLSNIGGNPSASINAEGSSSYSGLLVQAGFVLPLLRNLDFWGLYQIRNWTPSDSDDSSSGEEPSTSRFRQFSGHLVYYF